MLLASANSPRLVTDIARRRAVYRYGEGAFEREVEAALARQPMRVDISDLKFIDSAGLAVPVRTAASVGQVAVRNPSPILRRVLAATGLTDLLGIEP